MHVGPQVLDELDMGSIPVITAWNKADACPDPEQVCPRSMRLVSMAVVTAEAVL